MPRARTSLQMLARLLEEVAQPLYALDDRRRIVFCNSACAAWLGVAADELVGQRCDYHSGQADTPAAQIACSLCPPPEAFAGSRQAAVLCIERHGAAGEVRRAEFLPLPLADGAGVLVIVAADAAPNAGANSFASPMGEGATSGDREMHSAGPLQSLVEGTAPSDDPAELHAAIARFRQRQEEKYALERWMGTSAQAVRMRAQLELAGASHVNVVIVGPPGSGKHHLARAIHHLRSAGRASQLVPLACALLGADLLRSTLGALGVRRIGPDESPATLLLNQIDQLPAEVHADLQRLLSAGSAALGVIATSSADLLALAAAGKFSAPLAWALSTLVIAVPPLAERPDDLPLLAQVFLEERNASGGKQLAGFTGEALDVLAGYLWPGNLDELAAVVAEAHRHADGTLVTANDLPRRLRLASDAAAHPAKADDLIVLDEFLRDVERELISRAILRAKGNKARAARLLGLTRPRLYRRLAELGMEDASGSGTGDD